MAVEVRATKLAKAQIDLLRSKDGSAFASWLEDLRRRGCAALDYRLTGDVVDRLCVRHIRGPLRAVVAFESSEEAVVLLVGPHDDQDPEIDVYTRLYESLGLSVPAGRRTKPPCCSDLNEPPAWGAEIDDLVALFDAATRRRRR
ncbi:hypothetical protein V1227_25775 [Lentzea sp. DG1S-22]|uniref:hypothetical protein n=1 Tax=Lentzea sp. DG1S-22 TaxID=3108822 RepID=UPI002E7885F7|nr:hypothetical protein [Lentzea sp. DG1S-22]WVH78469.1 hypothetical protein V1227_25775 [Lentzea sp. DG1S-22]